MTEILNFNPQSMDTTLYTHEERLALFTGLIEGGVMVSPPFAKLLSTATEAPSRVTLLLLWLGLLKETKGQTSILFSISYVFVE